MTIIMEQDQSHSKNSRSPPNALIPMTCHLLFAPLCAHLLPVRPSASNLRSVRPWSVYRVHHPSIKRSSSQEVLNIRIPIQIEFFHPQLVLELKCYTGNHGAGRKGIKLQPTLPRTNNIKESSFQRRGGHKFNVTLPSSSFIQSVIHPLWCHLWRSMVYPPSITDGDGCHGPILSDRGCVICVSLPNYSVLTRIGNCCGVRKSW